MNERQLLNQVKLNTNIEIIYKNLWAVNFAYLSNGWLQGIIIDNLDIESYLTIVGFGANSSTIVILNKGHKNYEKVLSVFKFIMKLSIKEMQNKKTFYKWFRCNFKNYKKYSNAQVDYLLKKHDISKVKEFYNQSCLLEIQRRKDERVRRKKGR